MRARNYLDHHVRTMLLQVRASHDQADWGVTVSRRGIKVSDAYLAGMPLMQGRTFQVCCSCLRTSTARLELSQIPSEVYLHRNPSVNFKDLTPAHSL